MRLVVAVFFAIAASGALGFNYSRDRLGGMAVVFYALASYYALRTAAWRFAETRPPQLVAVGVALMLLSAGWQLRAIGTVDSVRARAANSSREWICKRASTRAAHASQPVYLRIFDALEAQGIGPIRLRSDEYVRRADSILGSQ
jgi:hypothetical protein